MERDAGRVVRALGSLENRFVYEGRAGHEAVHVFEVAPVEATVFARPMPEGRDPAGVRHRAEWRMPAALVAPGEPLYPSGVLTLLEAAG